MLLCVSAGSAFSVVSMSRLLVQGCSKRRGALAAAENARQARLRPAIRAPIDGRNRQVELRTFRAPGERDANRMEEGPRSLPRPDLHVVGGRPKPLAIQ